MRVLGLALALASAGLWGAGDFAGGIATRRVPVWSVVLGSQAAGLLVFLALALVSRAPTPGVAGVAWGGAAGLAGGIGVAALYRALASGQMGVIAPLTGVGATAIPIVYGLLEGERPSDPQWIGVALAVLAIALASSASGKRGTRGVGLALIAAAGFGTFFIFFQRAGAGGVLWPLVCARVASVSLYALGLFATRRPFVWPGGRLAGLVVLAGVLDTSANGLYLAASQLGMLSVVAVLASLYPVVTVILARLMIDERLSASQKLSAALALGGVALISVG
jgi:drug/metabolite transporter (DMT)-like permease